MNTVTCAGIDCYNGHHIDFYSPILFIVYTAFYNLFLALYQNLCKVATLVFIIYVWNIRRARGVARRLFGIVVYLAKAKFSLNPYTTMEVQQLLQTAASATVDPQARNDAGLKLQQAAAEHFAPYMGMLAQTLANSDVPVDVRMLAALAMKNELTAKNRRDTELKKQRWSAGPLSGEEKQQIKTASLSALADGSTGVGSAAAQLVAAIATIELPLGQWPDLTVLLVTMTNQDQPSPVKKAALTTIGYICENADPNNPRLEEQMNGFLTATVQAVQKTEPDETVRLAGINALSNSLEFIKPNFAREAERNLIMMAVCEATQNTGEDLQSAAFGCLAKVMYHYYEYMLPYMEQALYALTISGMQSKFGDLQCMAIEFWSTLCEVEDDLQHEEGAESFRFVAKALPQVLPPILQLLVKEDEDQDEDEWNVHMAAGTCVELMAKVAGDAVLDITMAFVAPRITAPDWAQREAAIMAFGSVLYGPDADKMTAMVRESLPPLAGMIRDPSTSVRETVAWCLGRIADLVVSVLEEPVMLQTVLEAVLSGLQDDARVAMHCCWAIMNLSEQINPIPQAPQSPLSPFYEVLLQALVQASGRPDNEHSARTSAYEALSSLVVYAPEDTLPLVMQCSSTCDERMRQSLQMQLQVVSVDDRQNVEELQVNLLGLLTSIIRRVEHQVAPAADNIMELLGQFLRAKFPNSLTEDDIFTAMGAVAGSVGADFAKYVPSLLPFLQVALTEVDLTVSSTAVGLITDITHALGEQITPYAAGFMQALSQILASFDSIRPGLVPPSLACIGDIASAIGPVGHFDAYLLGTEDFLANIAQSIDKTAGPSMDAQAHAIAVKEAILDAHVGIVAGYQDQPDKLQTFVPRIFEFLAALCQDTLTMEVVGGSSIRNIVGLIGDLAAMYPGKQFQAAFRQPWVSEIITNALADHDTQGMVETAKFALHEQKLQLA